MSNDSNLCENYPSKAKVVTVEEAPFSPTRSKDSLYFHVELYNENNANIFDRKDEEEKQDSDEDLIDELLNAQIRAQSEDERNKHKEDIKKAIKAE